MSDSQVGRQETRAGEQLAESATAPARWLLQAASDGGVQLTQTYALARAVVREATQRWPEWWDADLFGPPHREADVAVLEALHEGLRRLRLVRRRGHKLHVTARGRKLAADPIAVLHELALDIGGGDPFSAMVADEVTETLGASAFCTHDQLVAPAHQAALRGGWRDPAGKSPGEQEVSWVVGDVLRRGEAYRLIERKRGPDESKRWRSLISLSLAAALVLGQSRTAVYGRTVFVFEAELLNVRGVSASIAAAGHEHLTALHDGIQQAFGWADDHLYSFWLDAEFWGDDRTEFVRPGTPDSDSGTADVPLDELDLNVGAKLAYVFDSGDEWRVMVAVRERLEGRKSVHCLIGRRGTAPPQYPPLEDE
jgi:Plasmid pRiA4b ORF-3-like protein